MKKSLLILMSCLTLFSFSPVQAGVLTKNDVQLRDDVILNLLFHPSIKHSKNISHPTAQFLCIFLMYPIKF
jgi:hypothetical protein